MPSLIRAKLTMSLQANESIDKLYPKVNPAQAAVKGGVYSLASSLFAIGIQLGSVMVLARLLAPETFGLIAMLSIFTGLAAMLKDAGLSAATVQREHLTHAQISNLFWCNVMLGLILTLTFAALAPVLAWLYHDDRILNIVLFVSISYTISGLSVQQNALLRRQMRYGLISAVSLIALACSSGISIIMALLGWGYWSLASAFVSSPMISGIILWNAADWRPCRPSRGVGTMSLINFGASMTFSSIMNLIAQRADRFLLGLAAGPEIVGLYSKARNLSMMPKLNVVDPLSSSSFASLSRVQDDPTRFTKFYLLGIELIGIVAISISVFLFLAARDIVIVLLGEQWLASINVMRVLAILALFESLNAASGWLLIPLGRGRRTSIWTFYRTAATLSGIVLGLPHGGMGVATGSTVAAAVTYIPRFLYAARHTPINITHLAKSLWRAVAAGVFAATILLAFSSRWHSSIAGFNLLFYGLLYFSSYFSFLFVLPGGRNVLALLWAKAMPSLQSLRQKDSSRRAMDRSTTN